MTHPEARRSLGPALPAGITVAFGRVDDVAALRSLRLGLQPIHR